MKKTNTKDDKAAGYKNIHVSNLLAPESKEANKRARKLIKMVERLVKKRCINDGDSGKEIADRVIYALNGALQNPYTKKGTVKAMSVVWLRTCPDDADLEALLNTLISVTHDEYKRSEQKHSRLLKKPLSKSEAAERRRFEGCENADKKHRVRDLRAGDIDLIAGMVHSRVCDTLDEVVSNETYCFMMAVVGTSMVRGKIVEGCRVLSEGKGKKGKHRATRKPKRGISDRQLAKQTGLPLDIVKKIMPEMRAELQEHKNEIDN